MIALQNPLPGTRGTLGQNVVKGFGSVRFDASASKSFRLSENKSLQLRIDAQNVLNHPSPTAPAFNINADTFGNITGKSGQRSFQGQLRLQF